MKSFPLRYAGIALVVTGAGAIPFLTPPDAALSTYVAALGLMAGIGFVVLMSWRNALPTDSVGQLLQRTETGDRGASGDAGRRRER